MNIEKYKNNLPANLEDLAKFVLIGREKLQSVKAEIRAIEKLDLAKNVHEQKKCEAQDLASALLDAEVRIGQLLKGLPKEPGKRMDLQPGNSAVTRLQPTKHEAIKNLGFDKMQVSRFETLANHPEIVEQVKAEAIENNTIPVRENVLRLVQKKKAKKRRDDLKAHVQAFPQKKFQVILADPPWEYQNTGLSMSAEKYYPTMSTEEICSLKIDFADENCVLFMWVTNPLLEDSFLVLKSWGFHYKTNFVFVKNMPMITPGFYLRGQHELLLIAIKGSLLPEHKPSSVITGENKVHSQKPEIVYEIIEKMYPGLNYIELFARRKREGWASWGNEVES